MFDLALADIESLAPDARALNDAKKLTKITNWRRLGRDGNAIWGVALGSKGDAYAVFARSAKDVRCSCPSRKTPCKHGLALLLLAVNGHAFAAEALPRGHRFE